MFPTGIDRERSIQNWSSTGVRKWDKMKSRGSGNPGKLSEHFSSKAYNAAFRDYVNFMSNNSHVDSLLDTEVRAKAAQLQVACAADGVRLLAGGNNNRLRISAQLFVLARCLVPRNVYLFSIGSR